MFVSGEVAASIFRLTELNSGRHWNDQKKDMCQLYKKVGRIVTSESYRKGRGNKFISHPSFPFYILHQLETVLATFSCKQHISSYQTCQHQHEPLQSGFVKIICWEDLTCLYT
jgi:hypothetical protein